MTVRAGIEFEGTPAVTPATPHVYWTLRRVAQALGKQYVAGPRLDDRSLSGISTDTRTMKQGDVFVALRGDNHDAHDWLVQARHAGAAAVIVERPEVTAGLGIPVLVVHDTRAALGLIARAWRRAWGGTVVAVGGSNGKTSTKEMLRAVLSARLDVHATASNENNLVGVPLTLLSVPSHAHVAVIEVGTNAPGEIEQLRAICEPDIAVVTSIGEEHLEGLGDLDGVLREEAAVFENVATAVMPTHEQALFNAAQQHGVEHIIRVGLDTGDLRATSWSVQPDGFVQLSVNDVALTVPMRGQHHACNAMLALAVAQLLGVPLGDAAQALNRMKVPAMRGGWETAGSLTIINDAYNANPPSMRAALALLQQVGAGRQRVAVLGTMRELGPHSDAQHDAIAREAMDALNNGVDMMVAVGEFALAFARVAPNDPRVRSATNTEEAWTQLQQVLSRDAMVLLKGSRGVRLERLLPQLTSWATS